MILKGEKNGELEPKISYFHDRLGNDLGNVLVTDDVFKLISEFEVKVKLVFRVCLLCFKSDLRR